MNYLKRGSVFSTDRNISFESKLRISTLNMNACNLLSACKT